MHLRRKEKKSNIILVNGNNACPLCKRPLLLVKDGKFELNVSVGSA